MPKDEVLRRRGVVDDVETGTKQPTIKKKRILKKRVSKKTTCKKHSLQLTGKQIGELKIFLSVLNLFLALFWYYLCVEPKLDAAGKDAPPTFREMVSRTFWEAPRWALGVKFFTAQPFFASYGYVCGSTNMYTISVDAHLRRLHMMFVNNNMMTLRLDPTDYRDKKYSNNPKVAAYGRLYPNLGHMLDHNKLAEAGIFTTHLRYLKKIVDKKKPHAFLFEDDAIVLRQRNENGTMYPLSKVWAPYPADVIWLANNVTKVVSVARGYRVFNGSGTYGMIVTNRGANKLLKLLKRGTCYAGDTSSCYQDQLDVAIMKYARHEGLQVYLPHEWPIVRPSPIKGTLKDLYEYNNSKYEGERIFL